MGNDLAVRSDVDDDDDDDEDDEEADETAATLGVSCGSMEELLRDDDDVAIPHVANKQMNNIKNVGSLWYVIIVVVAMFVASVDFICKLSTITLDFR